MRRATLYIIITSVSPDLGFICTKESLESSSKLMKKYDFALDSDLIILDKHIVCCYYCSNKYFVYDGISNQHDGITFELDWRDLNNFKTIGRYNNVVECKYINIIYAIA